MLRTVLSYWTHLSGWRENHCGVPTQWTHLSGWRENHCSVPTQIIQNLRDPMPKLLTVASPTMAHWHPTPEVGTVAS